MSASPVALREAAMTGPGDEAAWHPVARSDDAIPRHVYQAKLQGRELALWRADDGYMNAWENRCLHRGVRLSVGSNLGTELRCIYHGWRYSSRTAGCTYIPAHPADAPAQTICNRIFPCEERYGLVWVTENDGGSPPSLSALDTGSPFPLRSLPFNASTELVLEQLSQYRIPPGTLSPSDEDQQVGFDELDSFTVELRNLGNDGAEAIVVFVQPVDSGQCVVRPVLSQPPGRG